MFRLSGVPQIDAAEEKRRVRESVKTNVFSFLLLCSAIRLGKHWNSSLKHLYSSVNACFRFQLEYDILE